MTLNIAPAQSHRKGYVLFPVDEYDVRVRDLSEAELRFTLTRHEGLRRSLERTLLRVAVRNRLALLGGIVVGLLAVSTPAILLGVLPLGVIGLLWLVWMALLLLFVRSHERLNGTIHRWRAEERGLRDALQEHGGMIQALKSRLGSGAASG